jgi:hypothetical protein
MQRIVLAVFVVMCTAASAPAQPFSPADLTRRTIERRAVEAAIWGMPLVNFDAMRQAYFRDAGAQYNDVMYWSKPSDWKNQTTTPNHSTNYVMFFMNLQDGPVVVDIPAAEQEALYGTLIDSWTIPLLNVGNTGEDKGKGGKYLLLPAGSQEAPPAGYIPVQYATYNAHSLLRVITKSHSQEDLDKGIAYLRRLKIYPLASAASPPPTRFIDIADKPYEAVPVFDDTFYVSLARMVAEEPVLERDMTIMGQLRSLDIGKGVTFKPDAQRNAILKGAAAEAHAYLMEGYATNGDLWWEAQRKWRSLAPLAMAHSTKLSFIEPGRGVQIDERAYAWFAMFGPVVPPPPQVYMKTYETGSGERLSGGHTYRLRVPAHVPASQFWAIDVYDASTGAFIREAPAVGLDSYNQNLQKNPDGTVDLYFAPTPPAGQEGNWVTTTDGKPFFVMFRIYGPQKPIADKSWVLNDIERVN